MYINDVHILTYIVFFIIGAIVGQFIEWINKRVIEEKKIFSKDIKLELKKKLKINYFSMLTTAILYVIVLYRFGIKTEILGNLNLIKYIVLIPILISIMIIDYKKKIIPNRLTLTVFESGIIFTFLYGIDNLFIARDYFLGMIVGFAIFAIISMLGRLIAGKEAMGLGDVKLVATLGLYFGTALTISISIISFIIAGVISIVILQNAKRKNKKDVEYISFGPCIVLSALLCIVVPEKIIVSILLAVFTLGRYNG